MNRVLLARPDIVVLTERQAWANYCVALREARWAHKFCAPRRAKLMERAARDSLDTYFRRLEAKLDAEQRA